MMRPPAGEPVFDYSRQRAIGITTRPAQMLAIVELPLHERDAASASMYSPRILSPAAVRQSETS